MPEDQNPASAASTVRRAAGNAAALIVAEILAKLSTFVLILIVARGLGTAAFGYFMFAFSLVPIFLVFANWGLDSAVVREIAVNRDRLSAVLSSGLLVIVVLGIAGLAGAFVTGLFLADSREAFAALVILGFAIFIGEFTGALGSAFKGFERLELYALLTLAFRVFSTGLAGAAIAVGGGLTLVSAGYLAGALMALGVGVFMLKQSFPQVELTKASRPVVRELLGRGTPLAAAGFLNMASYRVDSVLIQGFRGATQLGVYSAAYRLLDSLLFFSYAFANIALPRMSRTQRTPDTTRTFELTAAVLLCFYVPIAVCASFSSEGLIRLLFSERYVAAAPLVPILLAAGIFYSLAHLARMGAIALGHRSELAWIAAITLAANVGINIVAIPRYGIEGAAWATLGTEALGAVLLVSLFIRIHERPRLRNVVLVPVLASLGFATLAAVLGARDFAAIGLLVFVYPFLVAGAAIAIAPNDVRTLRSLISGRTAPEAAAAQLRDWG